MSLTLKYSYFINANCLPVRKRFSVCAASSLTKTLLSEVSVDDLLEDTHYFRAKNLELCLRLCSGERLAPEDTSLQKFMRQIRKIPATFRTQVCHVLFSWKGNLSPIVLAPPQEHENLQVLLGDHQDIEMDRQRVTRCGERTRLHPFI